MLYLGGRTGKGRRSSNDKIRDGNKPDSMPNTLTQLDPAQLLTSDHLVLSPADATSAAEDRMLSTLEDATHENMKGTDESDMALDETKIVVQEYRLAGVEIPRKVAMISPKFCKRLPLG